MTFHQIIGDFLNGTGSELRIEINKNPVVFEGNQWKALCPDIVNSACFKELNDIVREPSGHFGVKELGFIRYEKKGNGCHFWRVSREEYIRDNKTFYDTE
jgi:hypothetical protein